MILDIEHLRNWIGRTETASELVTESLVRRFAATFDSASATDETAGEIQPGMNAPRMLHYCLAQPAAPTAALGLDGHPDRGGFLPPVPLPRRMWAGGALDFHGELRGGEVMTRRSEIRDVVAKEGRSGLLCFVTVAHEVTCNGRAVLTERQDIVYRPAILPGDTATAQTPVAAETGAHCRRITPSAALLFRYSALTFNGHRIHYDTPFARSKEGYPGLVVHGPLQATLLAQFAQALLGRLPSRFSFRSLSPLFDTGDFMLHASATEAGLTVWTAAVGGPVAMLAEAE